MDLPWLLCNECFKLWDGTKPNLFLTECLHVFCGKCASKLFGVCFVCKATGFQITPITSSMRPEIAHLFTDLEKSVESSIKMSGFQNKQSTMMADYESFLESAVSKLEIANFEVSEDMEKISQQHKQELIKYNHLMKYRAQAAINQTPTNSRVNVAKRAREEHNQSPSSQAKAAINQTPRRPRVNFAKQNTVDAKEQNRHAPMQVDSDDSEASGSTIRAARSPATHDGVFRVPTTPKMLRKVGISIGFSGALRKRKTSHDKDRGYASDSRL